MKWIRKSIVNRFLLLYLIGVLFPTFLLSMISYRITYDVIFDMSSKGMKDELQITAAKLEEVYRSINSTSARITLKADVHKAMRENYDSVFDWYVQKRKLYDFLSETCSATSVPLECMIVGNNGRHVSYIGSWNDRSAFIELFDDEIELDETRLMFFPTTLELKNHKKSVMLGKTMHDMSMIPSGRIGFLLDDEIFLNCMPQELRANDHQFFMLNAQAEILLLDSDLGEEEYSCLIKAADGMVSIGKKDYILCSIEIAAGDGRIVLARPAEEVLARLYPWQKMLVISGFVVLLLGMVLGIQVFHMLSRPLKRLYGDISRVGMGDFNVHFHEEGSDEVARLSGWLNNMCEQLDRLMKERIQQEHVKTQFEIVSRQNQINTHFLTNTLNNVKCRAILKNEIDIVEMLESLGAILEAILRTENLIPLDDELKLLENYLRILRWRYEEKCVVFTQVRTEVKDVLVPVLLFQPLIENAVLHGMNAEKPLTVLVEVYANEEKHVILSVKDNGIGMDAKKVEQILNTTASTAHIGLANLNRRCQLAYGEDYVMTIDALPGEGCCVKITLPRKG